MSTEQSSSTIYNDTPLSFLQESTISSSSPTLIMPETTTSTSVSEDSNETHILASSMSAIAIAGQSTSLDSSERHSSISSISEATGANGEGASLTATPSTDIDPQILEALKSKDRLYVLKLGEIMESLISDRSRPRADVNPVTSYQRLLVHRCSAYYKLVPENDPTTKTLFVCTTAESRVPPRRLADLVPPEAPAQPAFKIMQRALGDRRQKPHSNTGSIAGDENESSDAEPSETGSQGGRSNATGGSNKKRMTIEEREAAYNEARSRIFMNFEEKEKEKEKDVSASSSSTSLASASTSGGSVYDDIDDSASSFAPESEWSAHSFSRDRKEPRRSNNVAGGSSSRSLRSSAPPFKSSGSGGSSRNSRASSPSSFSYASLYEPPQSPGPWDPAIQGSMPGQGYHPSTMMYPTYPPGQTSHPQYMAYPYYPQYPPYPTPPPPPQNIPDQNTPPSGEFYTSPPPMAYPYMWRHPPMQMPPPMQMQPNPTSPTQSPDGSNTSTSPVPPQTAPSYHLQAYMHPPNFTYPASGYWTPQPNQPHLHLPPHMGQSMYDLPGSLNGTLTHNDDQNSNRQADGFHNTNDHNRGPTRNGGTNMGKVRSAPPQPRTAWSYGPGIGMGGTAYNNGSMNGNGEPIGPRFGAMRRQTSQQSNGSSHRRSSNNDEVSSTASSSTSSSSRRTYTSTASSSHHPLPPRPDWAVGLKPDPTLHSTRDRHHDHSRNMSPMPRNGSSHSNAHRQRQASSVSPGVLHPTDFPPLSSNEKRPPAVVGAWTNAASRTLLMNPPNANSQGSALAHHPNMNTMRQEEPDRTFERPPPRAAELYNPKLPSKPSRQNGSHSRSTTSMLERSADKARGEIVVEQNQSSLPDDATQEGPPLTAAKGATSSP